MRNQFSIIILLFFNLIFCQVNERKMNENFFESLYTVNIYYLITFKDLNTNIVKEICIQNNDFSRAIEIENDISFKDTLKSEIPTEFYIGAKDFIKKNGTRHFKFQKKESLEILNDYYISEEEMKTFIRQTNLKSLFENINNDKNWFLETTSGNYKNEKIYAYFLSKKGYRIGYFLDCIGQNGLFCISCLEGK